MKSSVYRNAAVITCSLGLLGLLVGCWGMSVSFETTNPQASSSQNTATPDLIEIPSTTVADHTVTSVNVSTETSIPATPVENSTKKPRPLVASNQNTGANAKAHGTLRMMNQTNQPVRLALLARQSKAKGASSSPTSYNLPAHWDFAPKEGSEQGLLLSLPNGNLKLEQGDILVAFAQDGSGRYWGPYVVGETSVPKWNSQSQEWQLILSQ